MPISESQQEANRRNAQASTGPRTEEGKKRSRLNAMRHGITAKVLVMTEEELAAYQKFNAEMLEDWQPQGAMEKVLVQNLTDSHWRGNCIRSYELAFFALNHEAEPEEIETNPEVHATLAATTVISKKTKELNLISLYDQRNNRSQQNIMKQLRELQAERKARESMEMEQASDIQKMFQMLEIPYKPSDSGFVFSSTRLELFQLRQQQLNQAQAAKEVNYNREKFQKRFA